MTGSTTKTALCLVGAITCCGGAVCSADNTSSRASTAACGAASQSTARAVDFGRMPLFFEINRGQMASDVRFFARGAGFDLFLTAKEAVFVSTQSVIRMRFLDANRAPVVTGLEERPGKVNYLRGRDPGAWRTNVPTYAEIAYRDLYPGISLVFSGHQSQLEYDLIVEPHADPRRIVLSFDGVDSLAVTPDGDLTLRTPAGELRQHKPVIYQQAANGSGAREMVDGRYVLRGPREVAFEVGRYDHGREVVIDPVLAFSSYLGGTGTDMGQRIAVDATGHAYLIGTTASADFPVTTGGSIASEQNDVFVAKVNPAGNDLVYATYVGGAGNDRGRDIAIDAAGRAYITGFTASDDFPLVNAVDPSFGGVAGDAFVAELDADGDDLVYSTYLSGSARDIGESIAVDRTGNTYITGSTRSTDFPITQNAYQTRLGGIDPSVDAFITKIGPGGTTLVYSTYLGGSESDEGTGIAVNAAGNAFISGVTGSADFPKVNPFQATGFRGISDAFVSKLSADGSALVYSSNLGGDEIDVAFDITIDSSDRAIIVGQTMSANFAIRGRPLKSTIGGAFDGFITVVSPAGSTLLMSTYFGGSSRDEITGVALGPSGHIYVVGRTFSTDFPVVRPVQSSAGGDVDAFVARIDLQTPRVVYASYLGGESTEDGAGIAVDPAGSAYVIGSTQSDLFPVARPLQRDRAGDVDAFFAKIADFDLCLQQSQNGPALQINLSSGGYQLSTCNGNAAPLLGTGQVTRAGNLVLLTDRGVVVLVNLRTNTAFATITRNGRTQTIVDSNTTNSCSCP